MPRLTLQSPNNIAEAEERISTFVKWMERAGYRLTAAKTESAVITPHKTPKKSPQKPPVDDIVS
jgi:hypothetical protein